MKKAISAATLASTAGETPVGAVVVMGDTVVATAHNACEREHDATAHAEMIALHIASSKIGSMRLNDCELFVTMEPCAMCAGAIVLCRISRLVFGTFDARAGCCGSTIDLTKDRQRGGLEVIGGVLADDCTALLKDFFKARR